MNKKKNKTSEDIFTEENIIEGSIVNDLEKNEIEENIIEGSIVNDLEKNEIEQNIIEGSIVNDLEKNEIEQKTYTGKLINCSKLNMRKEPNYESDVISIIDLDTNFIVDEDNSKSDWYHVVDVYGNSGYCVKQYISLVH